WKSLKIFNRSLKSEFTNISAFYQPGLHDEFPRGREPDCIILCLPKLKVKGAIHFLKFAFAFHEAGASWLGFVVVGNHEANYTMFAEERWERGCGRDQPFTI